MGIRNNHYVPQCLLKGFFLDGLYEWDKFSGDGERRNVQKAGKLRGFYPDELEQGNFFCSALP